MFMQKVNVLVPPLGPVPPGAAWIANAVAWFFGGNRRVHTGLPAWLAAARARMAVERAARREFRARNELLALAQRYEATQPEFAKDLYAAARNERQI